MQRSSSRFVGGSPVGAIAVAVLLTGCFGTPNASKEHLLARATFDLACPAPQVTVQEMGETVRGVEGCGRRLAYVEWCESRPDGWHCTWVLNAPGWQRAPDGRTPRPPGTFFWTEPVGGARQTTPSRPAGPPPQQRPPPQQPQQRPPPPPPPPGPAPAAPSPSTGAVPPAPPPTAAPPPVPPRAPRRRPDRGF